jgi:hypothetical protein
VSEVQPYSARTVYWLLAVGVLSFAAAAYFMIYAQSDVGAAKANAFSYSAIGHRALVETLRELDIPVLVSRADSAAKAGDTSLLVVAEPRRKTWHADTIRVAERAETILVVLPKWDGFRDQFRSHWLWLAGMLPPDYVESILQEIVPDGTVQRAMPAKWNTARFGVSPTVEYPQLMKSDHLDPVISSDQGLLLGMVRRGYQTVWVLSDPDILSNHGLGKGENGRLAVRLLDALRPPGGAVIFDETVHGYWQPPSLWRTLFQIPFVIPVILTVAAVLIVAWSATARFGSPLPARPALVPGKTALIDNTASLLRFGGHGSAIVKRYADVTLRDVAHRLNAPRRLQGPDLILWVDRVAEARGASRKFRDLRDRADMLEGNVRSDAPHLAKLARRLYQWKREIINGS